MTIEELRKVFDAQPFRPFIIHLADGRNIPVQHREFLASAPVARTVVVYQPDGSFNIIDVMLVTDVEVKADAAAR
jgi:hypothetical protein